MECIKKKLNYREILRVRSSLYPRREKQKPDPFHVDYNFNHKVCIFYVNTNNGFTLFENGEKVNSRANRLIIFDASIQHKGFGFSHNWNPDRISLAFKMYID